MMVLEILTYISTQIFDLNWKNITFDKNVQLKYIFGVFVFISSFIFLDVALEISKRIQTYF